MKKLKIMRRLIFLLFLLPQFVLAQVNQVDANGLKQGFWQKKQANGRLLYEGYFKDGKPVGEWKRYHPGGQLKALIIYKGDTAYTQLFDVWRKKVAEGNYVNQKKEGLWKIYRDNRLVADEYYRRGIKNGLSHRYYDTGEVMEECNWVNGKKEGAYRVFFKNGKPYMECKLKNNAWDGLFLVYYENGNYERVAEYKDNLRHGEWKYYDRDGNLLYTLLYDHGQILNPQVRDSVDNLRMQELEKDKDRLMDPEKFMDDPSEYLMQMQKELSGSKRR